MEFLEDLFTLSQQCIKETPHPIGMATIEITKGDILKVDWKEADIVYIANICFP